MWRLHVLCGLSLASSHSPDMQIRVRLTGDFYLTIGVTVGVYVGPVMG